jgi:hypothetical protein
MIDMSYIDIPEIAVQETDVSKELNAVLVNLNYHLWLNELIEEFQVSHRRLYPQINIIMPDKRVLTFAYPVVDTKTADLVYQNKSGLTLRLIWR